MTSTVQGLVRCPDCGGDGHETCNNPDHGFIHGAMGWHEIGRLGCPGCGHDPDHKVRGGEGKCETCGGTGKVPAPNTPRSGAERPASAVDPEVKE